MLGQAGLYSSLFNWIIFYEQSKPPDVIPDPERKDCNPRNMTLRPA